MPKLDCHAASIRARQTTRIEHDTTSFNTLARCELDNARRELICCNRPGFYHAAGDDIPIDERFGCDMQQLTQNRHSRRRQIDVRHELSVLPHLLEIVGCHSELDVIYHLLDSTIGGASFVRAAEIGHDRADALRILLDLRCRLSVDAILRRLLLSDGIAELAGGLIEQLYRFVAIFARLDV